MPERDNNSALTAPEVADMLKIAKNTVYELIKRGEINCYKVGRKVRFTRADVEQYIARARQGLAVFEERAPERAMPRFDREGGFIIAGQDVMLDILSHYLARHPWGRPALRAHIGSYNGLTALYRGEVQAASVHLWDGDSGEYNRPYVRRLLPGIRTLIIRLTLRTQGLYVAAGNPRKIEGWADFGRQDLTMINRELGAGSRVLLDEHLRLRGLSSRDIRGYEREGQSHHAVASAVGRGEADLAVGHQKAAEQVSGLDFIPLQKEQYDLVLKKDDLNRPMVRALMEILRSTDFRREFEPMAGYDLSGLGEIVAET
ncbi:MAG: helix-turn-helix transcriptional regulator [Candidatus Adiutrix sp.]|jgi:putative molybdopterin biosynthesis protein|nr:helix-turn-helix transcriptional regulator [Candidatus Adiutrix sp.]